MSAPMPVLLLFFCCAAAEAHEQERRISLVLADRLEHHFDGDVTSWDIDAWTGGDLHKAWLKTEGSRTGGMDTEAEVQALYSRAFTPNFDIQVGIRHDFGPNPSRTFAVLGLEGVAPYWLEIDMALFLSDQGELSARLEAEYDLRLTQRMVLQPRLEMRLAASDVPDAGTGRGLSETGLGLRLRYEINRKLAPYLGLSWQKRWGRTADYGRDEDVDSEEASLFAGLRFWF